MTKSRVTIIGIIVAVLVALVLGLFLFPLQSEDWSSSEPALESATAINLGVTYLPVTSRVSAYYDLGVDTGVLITEVVTGSLADRAGVQVGDIILSYNDVRLGEGVPLFGMMRACPAGSRITMEIQRGKSTRIVELVHTGK